MHTDPKSLEDELLELGVRYLPTDGKVLILDFDATDDPMHGRQDGRFFHGYYINYCYLKLFCFWGSVPLWAQLRLSDKDASRVTVGGVEKNCRGDSADAEIKKLIRNWKHWTAQNFGFRWQRDFFEHRLRSDESLDAKAGYILENPVRAGLVAKPEDWPYRFVSGVTA